MSNDAKEVGRGSFGGFSFAKPRAEEPTNEGDGAIEVLKKQRDERLRKLKMVFASKMRQRFSSGALVGPDILEDISCCIGYSKAIDKPLDDALNKEEIITEVKECPVPVQDPPTVSAIAAPVPFSFGAAVAPMVSATAAPVPFSFGAAITTQPSHVPASASAPIDVDNDDAVPSEPPVKVEPISDPDWNTVHQVSKVKVFVDNDGKWKSIASGPLRVEKHTTKAKNNRIVIRDGNTGKVLLNCSIPSGGTITPQVAKNKYFVTFFSRRVDDTESKMFMMQTQATHHEALLKILTELSK